MEILSDFQVTIGTGCLRLRAYKLKYGGPLDCKQVQYIMGSCLGGGLLGVVIIVICYKRRKRFQLLPSGSPDVSHTLKVKFQKRFKRSFVSQKLIMCRINDLFSF